MGFFPDKVFNLVHDVVVIEVVHAAHEGVAQIVNGAVNVLVLHDITSIGAAFASSFQSCQALDLDSSAEYQPAYPKSAARR